MNRFVIMKRCVMLVALMCSVSLESITTPHLVHGDGQCEKLRDGTLLKIFALISHRPTKDYIGGHGHLKQYPSGLFGKGVLESGRL